MKYLALVALMILVTPTIAGTAPVKDSPSRLAQNAPLALASRQVIGPDRQPVLFAFRLTPNNEHDSGWVFWSGNEDQEFVNDNANTVVTPLSAFLQMDPTLSDLINRPAGTAWERDAPGAPWQEVPGYLDGP